MDESIPLPGTLYEIRFKYPDIIPFIPAATNLYKVLSQDFPPFDETMTKERCAMFGLAMGLLIAEQMVNSKGTACHLVPEHPTKQ